MAVYKARPVSAKNKIKNTKTVCIKFLPSEIYSKQIFTKKLPVVVWVDIGVSNVQMLSKINLNVLKFALSQSVLTAKM